MSTSVAERLGSAVRGPVFAPGHAAYDAARRTFNALIDNRPAAIVRPIDDSDVAVAVGVARDHGLPVSIRGGGHSVAGHSTGEDSVMIDLRLFREVDVDPIARIAFVGGGACWNDVDAPTQSFGLAMPGGTYGDTGVAGLTLTGGIGHLIGSFGLTLDNMRAATVVTASGDVVRSTRGEHPDLFWALRGGGGNFGVVTRFEFDLHEVALMTGGFLIHAIDDAVDALRAFSRIRDSMPDELTVMPALVADAGLIADSPVLLTSVAFLGTVEDAADAIAPLREPPPVFDNVGPAFYSQLQGLYAYMPFGLRNYWTGRFVQTLDDELIDALVSYFRRAPEGTSCGILFEPMHGAATRVDPADTAFAFRHARFNISPMAVWDDPTRDDEGIAWAREGRDLLQPLSTGGYLNYATEDAADTVEGAFGAEIFARLRRVKTAWDPENLFRFNHNIPPAR